MKTNKIIEEFIDVCTDYLFSEFLDEKKSIEEVNDKISFLLNEEKSKEFFYKFINIKNEVSQDIYFTYESDPACNSCFEIASCYPGVYAIAVYRIAHMLYELGEKVLARICAEIAHSKTGIDIHPGAKIDSPFFIDHGTGVVIGETSIIGKKVKLYQGVTLGAKSLENISKARNSKRHPTIEDNVTIYAYATILGGNTIIGENSIIGSNSIVAKSIDKNSKIISKCRY